MNLSTPAFVIKIALLIVLVNYVVNNCFASTNDDLNPENYFDKAEIRIIDKSFTKAIQTSILLKKNQILRYKKLEILMESCWVSPQNKKNMSALLRIDEISESNKSTSKQIFHGWIFSNNRQISNLENSIYQIVMLKCI